MKHYLAISLLFVTMWIACGCAAGLIAVGAATGVGVSYVAGNDTRSYEAGYDQAVRVSVETLNALKIPVSQVQSDELKTTIQARRADDTPVQIIVVRAGPKLSEIAVRTGAVGVADLRASGQIHDTINARLRRTDPGSGRAAATARPVEDPGPPPDSSGGPGHKADERPLTSYARGVPPELTIYFAADSNELRPSEIEKLDRVVETVSGRPEARLTLAGFTDSVGASEYNLMIAESRASTVKLYLVAKGIDPLKVTIVGKGASGFVAGNDSEKGRSLNRRVEISISEDR